MMYIRSRHYERSIDPIIYGVILCETRARATRWWCMSSTPMQASILRHTSKLRTRDSTFSAMLSIGRLVNRYILGLALIMWPYARLATRATLPPHPHVGQGINQWYMKGARFGHVCPPISYCLPRTDRQCASTLTFRRISVRWRFCYWKCHATLF